MKKMISSFGASLLSREQMKNVVGGSGTECSSCSESTCSGGCTLSSGYTGKCGWSDGRGGASGSCSCAGAGTGGIE